MRFLATCCSLFCLSLTSSLQAKAAWFCPDADGGNRAAECETSMASPAATSQITLKTTLKPKIGDRGEHTLEILPPHEIYLAENRSPKFSATQSPPTTFTETFRIISGLSPPRL